MKCKIIFDTKTVPTFEDFDKSKEYEGQSHYGIIHNICDKQVNLSSEGYLLTSDNDCYKFEYWKPSIIIENSFYSNLTFSSIGKLKPMLKNPLTFDTLRKANIQRLPEFKNSKGEPAHSKEDGSDWSPAQWLQAVIGELGEYANVMKKVERGDLTAEESKPLIEKELADVMTYLDILAFRVNVDLSKAVEQKFNEVSERVGCSLRIENNEVVRKKEKLKTEEFKLPVKMTDEEFKVAKEACRIPKEQREQLFTKKSFSSDVGGVLNEMIRWKLFKNYAEIYPLKIPHNAIDDVYSFEFQGIDNGKQYLFYHAKRIFLAKDNMNLRVVAIAQSNLFSFFSNQLGTKIVGMLINGSKENTKLNSGDMIQFYDDRNILWNFRLVKASEKNVEVSVS